MTTIARQDMMTWLTPIRISRRAVGISTLNNSCRLLQPLINPASATSGDSFFRPSRVSRTIGGVAKMTVAIAPA